MTNTQETLIHYLTVVSLLLTPSSPTAEGQIRLVGGSTWCSGRVEVYHNNKWGTVCDDGWDLFDAEVVCRQTDCGKAMRAPRKAQFGEGAGEIWLDDVDCSGSEGSLTECHHDRFGKHDCDHKEDAGVVCSGIQAYIFLEDYLLALVPAAVGGLLLLLLVFVVVCLLHKRRSAAVQSETQMSVIALDQQERDTTYEVLQKEYTDDYGVITSQSRSREENSSDHRAENHYV